MILIGALAFVSAQPEAASRLKVFIQWLFEDEEGFKNVRFVEVVESVSSHKVLPVDSSNAVAAQMLGAIEAVVVSMPAKFEDGPHPIYEVKRINETSRHIEGQTLSPRC